MLLLVLLLQNNNLNRTNNRDLHFRFARNPHRFLPLTVRSVGHYEFYHPCVIDGKPVKKWFSQVFWTVSGRGEFLLGDKWIRTGPGEIFLYWPGETHSLRHMGVPWVYRWVTFDHPEAQNWLEASGLKQRPLHAGACPEAIFDAIRDALHLNSPQGDRTAAHHAHAILLSILEGDTLPPVSDSPVSRCKHRMDKEFANPALTVEAIAADMAMHRSTLFRLFLKNYEITPSRYLHNLRIRKALSLLQNRDLQIQEAAWQSGFADPNYFSRAIREATGLRPQEFRAGGTGPIDAPADKKRDAL
ncbi:hypothetical protein DB346_07425 [Verrucomicrobia bacterium LW23]|nr:hypothetical protein DB346_07425 [Verrucomicrobia bacterium LW23]